MRDRTEDIRLAESIAERVSAQGGRVYYVGGYVRDGLLGHPSKDVDIEVHGVSVPVLEAILDGLGTRQLVGASFGVYRMAHRDLDIAVPRAEGSREGTDPFIGEEKAALRRDLTVNALMQDVLTGEICDFCGGLEDLEKRKLRHVRAAAFAEDPLRVLRVARLAAQLGFTVTEETKKLCSRLPLDGLAGERVMGETEKALMKAGNPSRYFEFLKEAGQLREWYGELAALNGVPQPTQHHPEGDVWRHTMLVTDEAARLRGEARDPRGLMFSALCHDLGKAVTTAETDGKLHAYRHETEGLPLVRRFLTRMTRDKALTGYVLNMTELHMRPNMLCAQHSSQRAFMKMLDSSRSPRDLLLLAKADHIGRYPREEDREELLRGYEETERTLLDMLDGYENLMRGPLVTGQELLKAGIAPGPVYAEALRFARSQQLCGVPAEEALRRTLEWIETKKKQSSAGSK